MYVLRWQGRTGCRYIYIIPSGILMKEPVSFIVPDIVHMFSNSYVIVGHTGYRLKSPKVKDFEIQGEDNERDVSSHVLIIRSR